MFCRLQGHEGCLSLGWQASEKGRADIPAAWQLPHATCQHSFLHSLFLLGAGVRSGRWRRSALEAWRPVPSYHIPLLFLSRARAGACVYPSFSGWCYAAAAALKEGSAAGGSMVRLRRLSSTPSLCLLLFAHFCENPSYLLSYAFILYAFAAPVNTQRVPNSRAAAAGRCRFKTLTGRQAAGGIMLLAVCLLRRCCAACQTTTARRARHYSGIPPVRASAATFCGDTTLQAPLSILRCWTRCLLVSAMKAWPASCLLSH